MTGFGTTPTSRVAPTTYAAPAETQPTPHILTLPDGRVEHYDSALEAHAARMSGKGGVISKAS